jgi:hypothetical protein
MKASKELKSNIMLSYLKYNSSLFCFDLINLKDSHKNYIYFKLFGEKKRIARNKFYLLTYIMSFKNFIIYMIMKSELDTILEMETKYGRKKNE